jgi:hypothetical protein
MRSSIHVKSSLFDSLLSNESTCVPKTLRILLPVALVIGAGGDNLARKVGNVGDAVMR